MVTTSELTATNGWLLDFVARYDEGASDDQIRSRLTSISFTEIVDAVENHGHQSGAISLYEHWIASQPPGSPFLFAAWFNLGVALSRSGNPTGAIAAYQNTLRLRPDFHSAATNLGLVLESLGQTEAALRTWQSALQPDEARTTLLNHRARLLERMNKLEEAEREMRRSLLIDPQQPDVIQHWVHVRQKMCLWPILTNEIPGLPTEDLIRHAGPLGTLALSDDIGVQREAARDWISRKAFRPAVVLSPENGYNHERIRVGYMSSDFCRHAMSYLIAELFERHDRDAFEIFGYCSSPDDRSEIRARIVRSFDHFRSIKHLPDEAAARTIRDDEVDILVDLNGLTSGARLQILRWKPAPVQATYLGFIGPVPLPELDYMFCDDIVVPSELASAYQPTPLRIAANYQANDSKRTIGHATTKQGSGLPEDKFVFCCFSNYYKITEEVFDAWMTILARCGDSVIWLNDDNASARGNMLARAAEHRVDGDRLIFASRVGPDEYMARLAVADLFLGTFPYNAGTIASDALRMGLPLLTISGQSFASRMAGRLLTAVGAVDGIVSNVEEYVERAVAFATDRSAFERYRSSFDIETWRTQIGDIGTFTASYENSLRGIVKRDRA